MLRRDQMYDYQKYMVECMIGKPEVLALADMGLGKTIATLTAICDLKAQKKANRILIVAPKRVAQSVWDAEIAKWEHTAHLTISKVIGTAQQRKQALVKKADLYITTRDLIHWLVELYGNTWPFDMVVIDELSSFKNPRSRRFKSLKMVRPLIKRVVGLTGTPTPNGLLDLWSQMFLVDSGSRLYESYTKFKDTYFEPGKRKGHVIFNYTLKKGNHLLGEHYYRDEIYDRISDIAFSMKTEDYLQLPDLIHNDINLDMDDELSKMYRKFERDSVLELLETGKEITAMNAAALTNKLLQFANGALYDAEKKYHTVHDVKLDALQEVYEALNGKPLLVFYSFISDRERLLQRFKGIAQTLNNEKDIDRWNRGEIQMFVLHPASAGHGLNLQFGGTDMCWFGLPWSLELYSQGMKRVHRNGVAGVVTNTRLMLKGSMDFDVASALNGKDDAQQEMINAVKARIEKYANLATV